MTLPIDPFRHLDPAVYRLPDETLASLATPELVVYLERVRGNVARMLEYVDGAPLRWRPHVKTTKVPRVWAELMRAGVRRFKCATVREARYLLSTLRSEGIEGGDVLLAYPLSGPGLDRLGHLARDYDEQRVSVLAEDPTAASTLPEQVGVFVDVNPGMDRTGIPLQDRGAIEATAHNAGPRLRGFHAYDGHRHEPLEADRRAAAHAVYEQVLETITPFATEGLELCTSGTPAFRSALAYAPFREGPFEHTISPGTVVYHDLRSELENTDLGLVPAALVLARAISHPRPGIVTLDSGSKAIGADAGDPCAAVLGHPELEARSPSEEHLPLAVLSGERPARGSIYQLVPMHVCTTVNLADEVLLVDGESIERVSVAARGH